MRPLHLNQGLQNDAGDEGTGWQDAAPSMQQWQQQPQLDTMHADLNLHLVQHDPSWHQLPNLQGSSQHFPLANLQESHHEQQAMRSSQSSLAPDVLSTLRALPPAPSTDLTEGSQDIGAEGRTLGGSTSNGSLTSDVSLRGSLQLISAQADLSETDNAWLMGQETKELETGMASHQPAAALANGGDRAGQDGWDQQLESSQPGTDTAGQRMQGLDALLRSHGYAGLVTHPGNLGASRVTDLSVLLFIVNGLSMPC